MLKRLVRESKIYRRYRQALDCDEISNWWLSDCPTPPPHSVKTRNVLAASDLFRIQTLVETGTALGAMITATKRWFKTIYSIELDHNLAAAARERFAHDKHVHILEGDSATLLPQLLPTLSGEAACFWLDGHFSGPGTAMGQTFTPILEELDSIALHRGTTKDLIFIDDARLFTRDPGYPSLEKFTRHIERVFGRSPLFSQSDAIVVLPQIKSW